MKEIKIIKSSINLIETIKEKLKIRLDHKTIIVYSLVVGAIMAFFLGRVYYDSGISYSSNNINISSSSRENKTISSSIPVSRTRKIIGYPLFHLKEKDMPLPEAHPINTILAFIVFGGMTYILLKKTKKKK